MPSNTEQEQKNVNVPEQEIPKDTVFFFFKNDSSVFLPLNDNFQDTFLVDPLGWLSFFQSEGYSFFSSLKTIAVKETYPRIEGKHIQSDIRSEIWFTPLLFIMFFIYGLIISRKKKLLLQDIKDFFSPQKRNNFFGDSIAENSKYRMVLIGLAVVNIALFFYFIITEICHYQAKNFILVFSLFFCIILFYILFKIAILKLITFVFFDREIGVKCLKTFNTLVLFWGIGLILVILCVSYAPTALIRPMLYLGIFFCFYLFFLLLFKLTIFFFKSTFSLFYLILYLCSIEILPILALWKALIMVITTV